MEVIGQQGASLPARQRLLCWLSLLGMWLALLVVLAGAWTRLVDAGLGCPDWPGCYGHWAVPHADVAQSHTPGTGFDAAKAWMEMLHRYLATLLGLVVVLMVLLGRRLRRLDGYPWRLSLALLCVVLVQGAFGALTVTLKLWPQVVTLHLLGGLAVAGLFLWLHLCLRRSPGPAPSRPRRLTALWRVALGLLVLQLALGGWTSSNYAGLACQGFPACNAQWWPSVDWGEGFHLTQTVGPEYLHGKLHGEARTAIQFAHRLGGAALLLSLVALAIRCRHHRDIRNRIVVMLGACIGQSALGASNVLLWMPAWLGLLHTAGAALVMVLGLLAVWQWRLTAEAATPAPHARPLMPLGQDTREPWGGRRIHHG